MQRLLPVGIRHLLPEDVVKPIILLSRFFSQLTAKTLRRTDMFQLRHDIVQVLCKFEMIFPPAFFTSMMHVMVHLPEEALLAGPVNYRWMYPIERLLGELKKSVRNRAKPEGSIVEAWVQYESLTFCGISAVSLPAAAAASYPGGIGPRPRRRWYPRAPPPSPSSQPQRFLRFWPNLLRRDSPSSGDQFRHLRYGFCPIFHALAECWMSDLITRRRAVTTTQGSESPTQLTAAATAAASAATAPALMDRLAVGPAGSQAPASSASSVAQPVSVRRRHRPASTTDATSTDASGSQPVIDGLIFYVFVELQLKLNEMVVFDPKLICDLVIELFLL
ncbi:hypothetical protein L3X38_014145 [Prunus dulcis]|uniref:DUF4218 domain-containing protein n=1 Tax=Prunus dulcis TaxID=3755 RepID=A0AAD4ZI18_PRUDU|nr:hypothetical protein L3X38_014145 [Prunus dulcis]